MCSSRVAFAGKDIDVSIPFHELKSASVTPGGMVFEALRLICTEFDLALPVWLDTNIKEFQKSAKTRFRQDSFIEAIPFDYLEIHVIEDDIP